MPTVTISDNTTGTPTGDFIGTNDAQLREGSPTNNYGDSSTFEVTKFGGGDHTHALIRFTGLTNITGPVTVTSATLGIWLDVDGGGTHTIDVRKCLRAWTEGDNTAANNATWNQYDTGSNWGTAGGLGAADRDASAVAQITGIGSVSQYYTTGASAAFNSLVEGWINGTVTNNGVHLERNGAGEDATSKTFFSSEGTNGNRPYLTVVYTTGGGGGASPSPALQFVTTALRW